MTAAMKGMTMIASTKLAVSMPMPKGGPWKSLPTSGSGPSQLDEPRLHVPLQDGREHEQAPDAVDDARHRGQQLDRDARPGA